MRITFRVNPTRDADILKWLQGLPADPGTSSAIRQVLRQYLNTGVNHSPPAVVRQCPTPLLTSNAIPVETDSKEVDEKKLEKLLEGWIDQ